MNTELNISQIVPRIVLDLPAGGAVNYKLTGENAPVERHLVADLFITYAFDLPSVFQIVAKRNLADLGVLESQIHELAMRNLSERVRKLEPEFLGLDNGVFVVRSGGDFEATLLLFDHVWRQAAERVVGGLVVSVPARDCVAFTGTDNRPGVAWMRTEALRISTEDKHALTRHLLAREGDGWTQYDSGDSEL